MDALWIVQGSTVVNLERVDRMQVTRGMVKLWTGEKMDAISSLSPYHIMQTARMIEEVIRPALERKEQEGA